jgi:hypothetical protein
VSDDDRLSDLRGRLEAIAEELADLALERLRDALEDPDELRRARAGEERVLNRARSAVLKAVGLLTPGEGG